MRSVIYYSFLALVLSTGKPPLMQSERFDVIIRNGMIYDGSGQKTFKGDIGIRADTIAAIGNLSSSTGKQEINAAGLAVSPGFINMLSWADESLMMDGRSLSDIKQGVTLEVFGEGWSQGPVKRKLTKPVDSLYTTLGGYFSWLMKKGVSPNVASFVGHTTIRNYVMGHENRKPTTDELKKMEALVAEAMKEGAMGLGTSLIYPPASYSTTDELIALATVASRYGGIYTTHLRSEGDFVLQALNEAITIGSVANIHVEIYHLKVTLSRNWGLMPKVIAKIDSAQKSGLKITANMYPYVASGTGLSARLPDWVQEGGPVAMRKRLQNPTLRRKVLYEMENGIPYKNSDPKDVLLVGFRLDSLNNLYKGKRLDEVARAHGKSADETVLDLVVLDKSRIEAIFFLISEENVRRVLQLPYVSFGSDAGSFDTTEVFAKWGIHPRAFGTFARVLGKYVREEKLISLEEAIRRMTSLPASNLKISKRGQIKPGFYADIAVFDPANIRDHATFENPMQFATGVSHVLVNGIPVLLNGQHTGAKPGRVVRGPGWKK